MFLCKEAFLGRVSFTFGKYMKCVGALIKKGVLNQIFFQSEAVTYI